MNSSVAAGPVAIKTGAIYAMSKAAMNQLTRTLACDWAPDNIRANAVAPWYISTELAQQVGSMTLLSSCYFPAESAKCTVLTVLKTYVVWKQVLANETYRDSVLNRTPMGRVGEPDEVAGLRG